MCISEESIKQSKTLFNLVKNMHALTENEPRKAPQHSWAEPTG